MVVRMKLASEFSVPASPTEVFPLFFDPDAMRRCIPGCEELERLDESTYRGRLVNEVAHVRFSAGFSAAIESVTDSDVKAVKAVLKGEDRKLGSSIKIDAQLRIRPDGDSSLVDYEMDMALWGKLGRLGEPIIRRRSQEVEREFAALLAAACAPQPVTGEPERSTGTAAVPTVAPSPPSRTARTVAVVAAVLAVIAVLAGMRRGR
ncbi:MAG: hypothetical protein GEU98_12570 [Pseudonocardiaceae bacterium]|nr:hypothetical protein [Pseudonocardiaceae bacterium]